MNFVSPSYEIRKKFKQNKSMWKYLSALKVFISYIMVPNLGYWNIRGVKYCSFMHKSIKKVVYQRAQAIRLLLEFTRTEFEDRKLTMEGASTYSKACWTDIKDKLGWTFLTCPSSQMEMSRSTSQERASSTALANGNRCQVLGATS